MENDKKSFIDYFNDEQFRTNLESALTGLAAIVVVIITKGFVSGFSLDLFLTLEPYASGLGVAIASSLLQNNMITRGVYDEIGDNENITNELKEVETLDKQITDYEYAEYFCEGYNKSEFERLQKIETEKQTRHLKYVISVKKSAGGKYTKWQQKLDYVQEYGAVVKKYKRVGVQDLLSFQNDGELKGADKINFKVIKAQRKKLARSKITMFLLSGVIAGLPLVSGDYLGTALFLLIWIPTLTFQSFKVYANSRRVTKTTYYKSLVYKKNVLQLCIDSKPEYDRQREQAMQPKEDFTKDEVIELIETKKE